MSSKLASYLDDEEDQAVTPRVGSESSLAFKLGRAVNEIDDISAFMSKLNLDNPKLFARVHQCISSVLAVQAGVHEESPIPFTADQSKRSKHSSGFHGQTWLALSRFIPLRLSGEDRQLLAILERTLKVSEYTDNVDIYLSKYNRSEVIRREVAKIETILAGQFVALKMSKSTSSLTEEWFSSTFEVARRYKAMNPDRLRETYVKLMHMLQDARHFGQTPIKTVANMEIDPNELNSILTDPLLDECVQCVLSADKIVKKYAHVPAIGQLVDSVKDYSILIDSFLRPVTVLLNMLETKFDPTKTDKASDLSIRSGSEGSRLSHSHAKQYQFVSQSLRLWKEVLTYFMPLWLKAEEDLLAGDYRLADTGQGLNRVQPAPRAASLMGGIVSKVQRNGASGWIGSSVVHMGDHNVPNALIFLDKYCQIPRILSPIAHTLTRLPLEYERLPQIMQEYIDSTFGGVEECQTLILADFFKHAFDGSGADNNYDAGSCIDGRLTSAWNWCSKIETKSYFPIFLLTNFVGFDGDQNSFYLHWFNLYIFVSKNVIPIIGIAKKNDGLSSFRIFDSSSRCTQLRVFICI